MLPSQHADHSDGCHCSATPSSSSSAATPLSGKGDEPGIIRRLDEELVNRIAAGEVVHRPAHALKEMLENSLDAGASSISVIVTDGGLKLLQIGDNGKGIARADYPLLCERFTTSKLRTYQDLSALRTYGFRGEALSSVSQVSHMTVTSMTRNAPCAYRAHFRDGKMVATKEGEEPGPRPCAGVPGTVIQVEDMFYNVPARLRALKSPAEEFKAILELLSRYSLHHHKISFTLKKTGDAAPALSVQPSQSPLEHIRLLFGVDSRLLFPMQHSNKLLAFEFRAYLSTAEGATGNKRSTFILFINGRLVESSPIKKAVESVYAYYLNKGAHPFAFFSIDVPPEDIDANVSPTKTEVRFLHEEELLADITRLLTGVLSESNSLRGFEGPSIAQKAQVR
jgi:DNA mismatch repair protein MLH1